MKKKGPSLRCAYPAFPPSASPSSPPQWAPGAALRFWLLCSLRPLPAPSGSLHSSGGTQNDHSFSCMSWLMEMFRIRFFCFSSPLP